MAFVFLIVVFCAGVSNKHCLIQFSFYLYIAPLGKSGGYTGFALSYQILCLCHSVLVSFCHNFSDETWISLRSEMVSLDQILYAASLGWGKGCLRFWDRLDQNSGFHGNRKRPLTYNGENDFAIFSLLFLIRSFSDLQVPRTGIKSRTCSDFGHIGLFPTELDALERLKDFPLTYNGKMVSPS